MTDDKVILVLTYHTTKEFNQFQEILDSWDELLDISFNYEILFSTTIDPVPRTTIPFKVLRHVDPPGDFRARVSHEWAFVAQHIERYVECACWFWWEADVLPVRPDCFTFFLQLWTPETQIMGYYVRDWRWNMHHKMNGVAFYSKHYWSFISADFAGSQLSFDQIRAFSPGKDQHIFVALNRWYVMLSHDSGLVLTPDLRLVHGIKDRTLLEQIRGGRVVYPRGSQAYRTLRYLPRLAISPLRHLLTCCYQFVRRSIKELPLLKGIK